MANIPDKQKALNLIVEALEYLHDVDLVMDRMQARALANKEYVAGQLDIIDHRTRAAYEALGKVLEMPWWGSKITPMEVEKSKVDEEGEEI